MSETEPHDNAERTITIPALALVVVASGEVEVAEAFAARHFADEETIRVEAGAFEPGDFEETRAAIARRLIAGQLTVAVIHADDAELTAALARMAHHYDVAPVAVTLGRAIPLARFPLGPRGYAAAHPLVAPAEWEATRITRVPLACDLRAEHGPFDIIGDVHGCYDELVELLETLGYQREDDSMRHQAGRRAIFVGDLVDRGPKVTQVARLAMRMVAKGQALCVPGNHDIKLMRALEGRHVYIAHGLQETLDQIAALPTEAARASFTRDFIAFIRRIPPYLMLEGGDLVVAHAGLPERYHGRISERIRVLVFYGETTGWEDEYGHPIRADWAADYRGAAAVVYGHTPHAEAPWRNNTIDIDTGCVHGGHLTAVRWPERDVVSVAAHREYAHRAGGLH
ncbi:MAG TPA: metallophosphoesterase [Ktedonobacterales bacterium]